MLSYHICYYTLVVGRLLTFSSEKAGAGNTMQMIKSAWHFELFQTKSPGFQLFLHFRESGLFSLRFPY